MAEKSILIVDDSATISMSLRNNLEIAGYNVETKANGLEAFNLLESGYKPDLIITDVNMPIMDGFEFIKKAKTLKSCRFTPILILTTESSTDRRKEAKSLGATGWLVKPCSGSNLIDVVKKFC